MYLGIDLGTSSVKLILLDEQKRLVGQCSKVLTLSHPKLLWSEQNPDDWWDATCQGMTTLKQEYTKEFSSIKAIGLSGQQHGATLLDKNGKVLRPAILWNDGRANVECEEIIAKVPHYAEIIGARMMPGFTAPKLLWVLKHEPEIFYRTAKIVLPKDYLRFKMTGIVATDMSDASGTGWLSIAKRAWSDEMLSACHLTQKKMPALFEGTDITGTLLEEIAEQWGLPISTLVIAGGGDNPAAAISMNIIEEGSAFLSLGTSGVYFVASDSYKTHPEGGVHSFCHSLPNRWHHMTVHLSAASSLNWLANTLQVSEKELLREAEETPMSHENIVFLPYLSGERSPHNNPFARGVFFGISPQTKRADLTRAVLEGVAFAFADGQDAMLTADIAIKNVYVVGGGAQSFYWGKILSSILNRRLIYSEDREIGGAVGAARLAWLALHQKEATHAFDMPIIQTIIEPDHHLVELYSAKRKIFSALYQQLIPVFHAAISIKTHEEHTYA
ncbi:MAG: hypothetical protein ACD_60C00149G0002 [uncultured bacterium]|nr:MAG: hypothetical protein ACD_60C00149G0002 [uncultured bacterium]